MSLAFRPIPRFFVLLFATSFAVGWEDAAVAAHRGADNSPPPFGAAVATADVGSPNRSEKPEGISDARKRTIVQNALLVVGGIALLGVLLIVLVVLGAIRIRQRNRKGKRELSETAFDPLWYLRTGPKAPKSGGQSTTTKSEMDCDNTT